MGYAFIGLGSLGARLANRLGQSHPVWVFDRDPARAEAVTAAGAQRAASLEQAVSGADAVVTCLPSPAASRSVMLGPGGGLALMGAGTCWIELSTVGPEDVSDFVEAAGARRVQVMDCPVTGGVHRAESGEMTVFVGASADAVARHRPALAAMCNPVLHLGPPGSASVAKLITNMLCLVDLIAAGDALLLARKAGLDLGQFYRAVVSSSGNSCEFEDWVPRILDGSYDSGFTLDLALKDLDLVSKLSGRLDVPLSLSPAAAGLLAAARDEFGGSAWTLNVIRLMAQAAGTELPTAFNAGIGHD